jgi:hypothetical protein
MFAVEGDHLHLFDDLPLSAVVRWTLNWKAMAAAPCQPKGSVSAIHIPAALTHIVVLMRLLTS